MTAFDRSAYLSFLSDLYADAVLNQIGNTYDMTVSIH